MVFGFDPEAGYTGLLHGKKAAVVYTSAVYGPGPARRSAPTSSARTSRLAALGGHRRPHRGRVPRPISSTADADTGRRAAHAAARDAGKLF